MQNDSKSCFLKKNIKIVLYLMKKYFSWDKHEITLFFIYLFVLENKAKKQT